MRMSFYTAIAFGIALLMAGSLSRAAQSYDCRSVAEHGQFDFWVGDWQVHAGEQFAGTNTITMADHGCLMIENWESAQGQRGHSLNYYDPETGQWRQLWVSGGVTIDILGGLDAHGSMVLTGHIFYYGTGDRAPFRGTWTPSADGSVRQFFEQQDADGNWNPWFDGRYTRRD